MITDSLFSGSWLGKQILGLVEKGCWYAVLFLSMQNSHWNKVGPLKQSGSYFLYRTAELDWWGGAVGCQEEMGLPFLSLSSLKAKNLNKIGTTHQQSSFGKAEFVLALRQSAYPGSSAGFVKPFWPKRVVEEAEHITYTWIYLPRLHFWLSSVNWCYFCI